MARANALKERVVRAAHGGKRAGSGRKKNDLEYYMFNKDNDGDNTLTKKIREHGV